MQSARTDERHDESMRLLIDLRTERVRDVSVECEIQRVPAARHRRGRNRRRPEWRPGFVDYLFLAFNTSTAFSPTDCPVLSTWAKILMMVQSLISLTTVALLAARAVNIL